MAPGNSVLGGPIMRGMAFKLLALIGSLSSLHLAACSTTNNLFRLGGRRSLATHARCMRKPPLGHARAARDTLSPPSSLRPMFLASRRQNTNIDSKLLRQNNLLTDWLGKSNRISTAGQHLRQVSSIRAPVFSWLRHQPRTLKVASSILAKCILLLMPFCSCRRCE